MPSMTLEQVFQFALKHHEAGHFSEAESLYRQILAVDPDHPDVVHFLGTIALQQGRVDEAIIHIQRSLKLNPNGITARYNLANAFRAKGHVDEALALYHDAVARKPTFVEAWNNLGTLLKETGRIEAGIDALRQAITLSPTHPVASSNLLLALHYDPRSTLASLAAEHRAWEQRCAAPRRLLQRAFLHDRNADRKLRIGYVSPDFQDHAVGRNMLPLFRHNDHTQFDIICYSGVLQEDSLTAEFRNLVTLFRSIAALTPEQLANQIREDRIDILVDLALHSANNRLLAFAEKPAPVQFTFAGYPGSTGLSTIDYRLTDAQLDPLDPARDPAYAEKSIRLPASFWCYDPTQSSPPVNDLPALTNNHLTFGCLNSFSKFNTTTLALWCDILSALPTTRMVILAPLGETRQRLLSGLNVAPHRIDFLSTTSRDSYLAYYHRIDIGLDTFPYAGHTTTLDALWMGVPVISLAGETAVSRAALSQFSHVGLEDFVTTSPTEYIERSIGAAANIPVLGALRPILRNRMRHSVLTNAGRFAHDIEFAYRTAWRTLCAQP